jgi:hypothetical protein
MNVRLLYRDRDIDLEQEPPATVEDLTRDLGLTTLLEAMANGDAFLFDIARKTVLAGLTDPDAIRYRQEVLADCLAHPSVARELYDLAVEGVQAQRRLWLFSLRSSSPDLVLHQSVQLLELLFGILVKVRALGERHGDAFGSEGFRRFFRMLSRELDDRYLEEVRHELGALRFPQGILMTAELGAGNKGTGYVLRRMPARGWRDRLPRRSRRSSFEIPERDDSGLMALAELRARGIGQVADALGRSAEHVRAFFSTLRAELAFYMGCLNLHDRLTGKGEPVCFPTPEAQGHPSLSARGLYDPCLSLTVEPPVVGNDLSADGRSLVMITGANGGGKSTLLRSIGLAYLMMQAGMFVAARAFRAGTCDGIFTHFKREEDEAMESGKLDEELRRMSAIADVIRPRAILLCNESFASTNELEGSEIARQVIRAMLETGIRVFFVTHQFDLADSFHREGSDQVLFLRAERREDGRRTFRILEGEPQPTGHAEDSYHRIFGPEIAPEEQSRAAALSATSPGARSSSATGSRGTERSA